MFDFNTIFVQAFGPNLSTATWQIMNKSQLGMERQMRSKLIKRIKNEFLDTKLQFFVQSNTWFKINGLCTFYSIDVVYNIVPR